MLIHRPSHPLACASAWPPTAKLFAALGFDLNLEIKPWIDSWHIYSLA